MAETTTIARPYARAAFEVANAAAAEGGLQQWSTMLSLAAQASAADDMSSVLASPDLDGEFKAGLLQEACGEQLNAEAGNFIKLLAENQRLAILPEIAQVYEELRAEAEKTIAAEMVSAFEVSDEQRQQVAAALSKRLQREVSLDCRVDPELLGGAVIRAGDLIIDGSAQGRLNKLAADMRR